MLQGCIVSALKRNMKMRREAVFVARSSTTRGVTSVVQCCSGARGGARAGEDAFDERASVDGGLQSAPIDQYDSASTISRYPCAASTRIWRSTASASTLLLDPARVARCSSRTTRRIRPES